MPKGMEEIYSKMAEMAAAQRAMAGSLMEMADELDGALEKVSAGSEEGKYSSDGAVSEGRIIVKPSPGEDDDEDDDYYSGYDDYDDDDEDFDDDFDDEEEELDFDDDEDDEDL